MKTISKILSFCVSLCLILVILITSIDLVATNLSFYKNQYAKGSQAAQIGMSDEDLLNATETLLDYIQDKRDDIVVHANVLGTDREVFNERETLHMVDVKNLYLGAINVRNILMIVSLIGVIALIILEKNPLPSLKISFLPAFGLFLVLVVAIIIWAVLDFTNFWIQFHYIFFDNDLFFLDPNTSIMINMFPEEFFFQMVIMIILVFFVLVAIIYALLYFLDKRFHATYRTV